MERDRESVGLTAEAQTHLRYIEEGGWFAEGQDIARLCLAFAVREGVAEGVAVGTETRWAAGNFDKTGEIRALLTALYPNCTTPVRLMEHLVNEGLNLVAQRLRSGSLGPADLIS